MKNAKKLLEKIQAEKITPIPRWHFVVKNIFFWGIGIFCILFGTVAFSIVLDALFSTETDVLSRIMNSPLDKFFAMIPFLWIAIALVFLAFAFFGMSHTKKGYKFSALQIWSVAMALSLVLGSGIYASGYAEKIEITIAKKVAMYHSINQMREKNWSFPDKGLLSGEIQEISESEKILFLEDWKDTLWQVEYAEAKFPPARGEHGGKNILQKGEIIRLIGEIDNNSEKTFTAKEIRGWGREYQREEHKRSEHERKEMHERMLNIKNRFQKIPKPHRDHIKENWKRKNGGEISPIFQPERKEGEKEKILKPLSKREKSLLENLKLREKISEEVPQTEDREREVEEMENEDLKN